MAIALRMLGIVPARGGSKGVPGKNIRCVGGRPLIAWTIEAALASHFLDRVICSSDDPAIVEEARKWGCDVPFVRKAHLATDESSSLDVVFDALDRCPGYEWVVLLQPTSPLRTGHDIDQAVRHCIKADAPSCVSVSLSPKSPYWMYTLRQDGRLSALLPDSGATRRQDLPPTYALNGAIYVANADWLRQTRNFVTEETVAYEMDAERSLDIDTEFDFLQLEALLNAKHSISSAAS